MKYYKWHFDAPKGYLISKCWMRSLRMPDFCNYWVDVVSFTLIDCRKKWASSNESDVRIELGDKGGTHC